MSLIHLDHTRKHTNAEWKRTSECVYVRTYVYVIVLLNHVLVYGCFKTPHLHGDNLQSNKCTIAYADITHMASGPRLLVVLGSLPFLWVINMHFVWKGASVTTDLGPVTSCSSNQCCP